MRNFCRPVIIAVTATTTLLFGLTTHPAYAQQKKSAQGKHQACLAKARAENPHRVDGHARQAAYNRCMGR